MKVFEKVLVAEQGLTKNCDWETGYQLVFTSSFIQSLFDNMKDKSTRCRKTHNGADMLDDLIGEFKNPIIENGNLYADLYLLDGIKDAEEMALIIEQAPHLVNCSVVVFDTGEADEENKLYNLTGVEQLLSIDLVGVGAATNSLFNKKIEMDKKKGLLASAFSFLTKNKKQFAAETVTDIDGKEITIEKVGEVIAIGDAVMIGGEPAADGSYEFIEGDEKYRLVVAGGVIENIEKVEEEPAVEPASPAPSETFAAEIEALKADNAKKDEQIKAFSAEIEAIKQTLEKATKFSAAPAEPNKSTQAKAEGISKARVQELKELAKRK